MKIGIIFGGQSREREISFAGGRTVYDNLNKSLFTPVPIFVDSLGNFILLNWHYLYKGTIRDFYPAAEHTPESKHFFQIYVESIANNKEAVEKSIDKIGRKIQPEELRELIDFAFLTLHGPYGEDGNIQGILEWYGIPYSGAGILPGSIGIDKSIQKNIIKGAGFDVLKSAIISRDHWLASKKEFADAIVKDFGFPIVIKAPHQGSSIGVNIAKERSELEKLINRSFFIEELNIDEWKSWNDDEKRQYLVSFTDIREGLGFPVIANGRMIRHPEDLWVLLDHADKNIKLESPDGESMLLIEAFTEGKEFSCIVIEDDKGQPLALPPTEIKKSHQLFDYRSKYLPGISRKITPIELPDKEIKRIRLSAEKLFKDLNSEVYARIDGFYTVKRKIILNDPNTTSGMLPSSFFFHQAAEIGLNPSQFLTYIIDQSLKARLRTGKNIFRLQSLIERLDEALKNESKQNTDKIRVAVIMGGFSSERHISVESGRNIYEKLASSYKYTPVPIFLTGDEKEHKMYQLPVNIMLKDNADDIREKVTATEHEKHATIEKVNELAAPIKSRFAYEHSLDLEEITYDILKERVDFAFIALHGRPGEDGAVQEQLEQRGIPYNGSGIESSRVSINKYDTNELLAQNGILVAKHALMQKADYLNNPEGSIKQMESDFGYPFIAKPADDGCSSAVKKIKSKEEFQAFCEMMFRNTEAFPEKPKKVLKLKNSEEFPQKDYFLIEELISSNGADKFLEITGGMLTHMNDDGSISFEVFEPSEALASGEVLSLEEKFLAGEGQNITPARFADSQKEYDRIASSVKETLEKTARLINVEGYCRIDAFVRVFPDKVETVIIEINSLPGMTPATAIFHQSAINEMKPYEFIDRIITYGFAKQKRDAISV
ncbi:D-alanine--D-alanine ligase [Marinoscillum sp. MHG1-6]|uniref:D-alanine--D-alanine ligase family protein n=1 Tax=Marinoscillum sp. MHG1-6 TaxID=2959627 RepID=UPI0021584B2C|nr:D-alanine--D-alanine ligase [Marinoscillum sp. MHG1-6]